jgi:hypothetical protein
VPAGVPCLQLVTGAVEFLHVTGHARNRTISSSWLAMARYGYGVSSPASDYVAMVDHGSAVAPYRQIAAILRTKIEHGEYAPGQRLPGIHDLMGEYGVAALTARKALRVLGDEGLAELSPGRGFYVRPERA